MSSLQTAPHHLIDLFTFSVFLGNGLASTLHTAHCLIAPGPQQASCYPRDEPPAEVKFPELPLGKGPITCAFWHLGRAGGRLVLTGGKTYPDLVLLNLIGGAHGVATDDAGLVGLVLEAPPAGRPGGHEERAASGHGAIAGHR